MATTINSYSVSLAMDASSYIKNSSLSRKETASLSREINSARSPADKFERSVNLLDKAVKKGAIDQRTYNRLIQSADEKFKKASVSSSKLAGSVKRMVGAYLGFSAAKSVISNTIQLTAEAEKQSVAFKVLIGDVEQANATLGELRAFAASTPFSFPEIQDAGRMLLAFNFSTQELGKELEILGNLAAGTNQPIGELAELVGKARVQTTIYSEDLNQFTGRGINVLDGLAKKFGVTTAEVKKLASEGKIGFSDLQSVLEELATGAGKFNGLMEEQSKTLSGSWSTLKDNVGAIAVAYGNELLPVLKSVVEYTSQWVNLLNQAKPPDMTGPGVGLLGNKDFLEQTGALGGSGASGTPAGKKPKLGFGKAPGYFDPPPEQPDMIGGAIDGVAGGLRDMGSALAGQLSSLSGVVLDVGAVLSETQIQSMEELIEATKDSPAIKSLEAGTQEAYQYMTDGLNKQLEEQQKEEKRHEVIKANGEKLLGKMTEAVDALKNNGFRRFR